jgi:hypothetical protein
MLDRIMELRVKGNNGSKHVMVYFNKEVPGNFPWNTGDQKYLYRKTGKRQNPSQGS